MNNKKIGIACLSIGEHAQRNILPAISRTESVELIGCYTRSFDVVKNVSNKYDCIRYKSEDELFEDKEVQAVYISSPTSCHYQQVKKALLANKSVIVEKTAFLTLSETEEILKIANDNGLIVVEAFMFIYHEQFKALKELIGSKSLGRILKISCSFGFPHLAQPNIRYSNQLGGGALLDAGAYTIKAFSELMEPPFNVHSSILYSEPEYDVDTSGVAILTDNNESVGICEWAFGGSYVNKISVWLEKAHIKVERAFSKPESFVSKITVESNGKVIQEVVTGEDNHFVNMFSEFSKLIKGRDISVNEALCLQSTLIEQVKLNNENNTFV